MSDVICLRKLLYYLACVCVVHVGGVLGRYEFKMRPFPLAESKSEGALARSDLDLDAGRDLPDHFELHGPSAAKNFAAYAHNIENVAGKQKLDVKYKVTVETSRAVDSRKRKRMLKLGKKPKKFNVPLKKESMKLSSLELMVRKMVEDHSNETTTESRPTTEFSFDASTKPTKTGKYRPIIGGVRTNFRSKVAPVKSKVFSLNATSNFGANLLPSLK